MAKNKISEWSSTPANNTDVGGIDIAEGCAPSGINNAMREMMAQIKDMQAGTDGDNFTVGGNLTVTGTTTLTTDLAITDGGTGASTAADARTNLGLGTIATQSASSVSITGGSITGITDLAVADGGTGASTLTGVVIGNGTSAMTAVAPSTAGNVLTSDGTNWISSNLFGGSNQSLTSNGYQKLPAGLILQWGIASAPDDSSAAFSFPISFPNSCFSVTASMQMTSGTTNYNAVGVGNITTSGARLYGMVGSGSAGTGNAYWFAIGY